MKKQYFTIMNSAGEFLAEFKTRGNNALSFEAGFTRNVTHALVNPVEENLEEFKKWASLVDGQVVVIKAEYSVKSLDNEQLDVEAIQEENKPVDPFKQALDDIEELFGRGEKNERKN